MRENLINNNLIRQFAAKPVYCTNRQEGSESIMGQCVKINKQPALDRICEYCNKAFKHWASLARHGKPGRFCSTDCFLSASRLTVKCDFCQDTYTKQKSCVGRYKGRNFCSRKCSYSFRKKPEDKIAVKRLRYGNSAFQKKRLLVIERDGMCQICKDTNANSVHHIDWNPYNNCLDNLILLCRKCHGGFKRYETFEAYKKRIMVCSELYGDVENTAEMPVSGM